MYIIQFLSIQKKKLLSRLVQKTEKCDSMLIFDLEDTLYDVDEIKSHDVKMWGRSELIEFSLLHRDLSFRKKVGVRINSITSNEFNDDITALSYLSKNWNIEAIIIPKVETVKELIDTLSLLKESGIQYKRCIPIVETIKGMKNLKSIASHRCVEAIIYGHNDYSLEMGHWPFLNEEEVNYWKIVSSFIQQIEKMGVRYIHPPIYSLSDEAIFTQIAIRLKKQCQYPFGVVTINSTQTTLFNKIANGNFDEEPLPLKTTSYSSQEKRMRAEYIKHRFLNRKERFIIDQNTKTFFSPHMYRAALSFLEYHDE